MNRGIRWLGLSGAAVVVGLGCGELLCRWPAFRDLGGRLTGRGHLVAMVNGKGIYETDLGGEEEFTADDAILVENLRQTAATEPIDPDSVEREVALLKAQFGDEKNFASALKTDGLSESSLREEIATQLRGLNWLEKQIGATTASTDQGRRAVYEAYRDLFTQPVRYRVSHLFLAVHAETPPEEAEEKERAIGEYATRLTRGETLPQLALEASEDLASKPRGGDLGYFAEARMPADFMTEIKKLRVGEVSPVFRTHLGFHIAQLTELKAGRLMTFEETRSEISLAIANERRAGHVNLVIQSLSRAEKVLGLPENLSRSGP